MENQDPPKVILLYDKTIHEASIRTAIHALESIENIGPIAVVKNTDSIHKDPFYTIPPIAFKHTIFNYINSQDPNIVPQKQPIMSDKVNRNSPCSCGSGKKAKKCCLK